MARFVTILFYFVLVVCDVALASETVTLETKLGKVKGVLVTNKFGRDYLGFSGIPFAKPPIGQLRFQPPQPADSWGTEEFDATKEGHGCPQSNFMKAGEFSGNEDCLVLNVFTPYIKEGRKLPVMVSIHGGGYIGGTGSSEWFGPDKFMQHDVVFVAIQYRVGLLGFLNTEDTEATGNYGMLDQVMALRWVKEHIDDFGGDKNLVTIFGVSAGGSSVSYHLLSPLSKGLFHGAIMQSGSTLSRWSFQRNPLKWAQDLARKIDCPTDTTSEMVECFRRKPAYELVKGNTDLKVTSMLPFSAAPSIDVFAKESFLPDDPLTLLQEGKINSVPVIAGITRDEGYIFYKDIEKSIKNKHEDFFDGEAGILLPAILEVEPHMSAVYHRIRDEYFKGRDITDAETFEEEMVKVVGHIMFDVGVAQTVDLLQNAGVPVRSYVYSFVSNSSFTAFFGDKSGKYVGHGDDGCMQFTNFMTASAVPTEEDKTMTRIMNTIWVNFAAGRFDKLINLDGKEMEWPLYKEQKPQYLQLTVPPRMKDGKICDKLDFWTNTIPDLIKDYRRRDEL